MDAALEHCARRQIPASGHGTLERISAQVDSLRAEVVNQEVADHSGQGEAEDLRQTGTGTEAGGSQALVQPIAAARRQQEGSQAKNAALQVTDRG